MQYCITFKSVQIWFIVYKSEVTVTIGDCVHKFNTEEALDAFLEFVENCISTVKDYILDIRDYEEGLVL